MKIEKLQLADIPALLELYRELLPVENSPQDMAFHYEAMLQNPDYALLVVKEDGKLLGSALGICCHCLAFQGKPFLVIEDVIVRDGLRGKGIGRKLFEALEAFALEKGCAYSMLVSSGYRKEAHVFYEKMGFTEDVRGFRKMYQPL